MKHLFLYIGLFFFVANNMVLSAWVKPCMLDTQENTMLSVGEYTSEEMPCHDESSDQQGMQCDGVCLCLNVLVTQTPVLDADQLYIPIDHLSRIAISNTSLYSLVTTPLYRPPISIS